MVSKAIFYEKVKVFSDDNNPLGKRIRSLLENVIEKLPNEEQFRMRGIIAFNPRSQAVDFWNNIKSMIPQIPDMRPTNRDGNCTYLIAETIENSLYVITIIIDDLDSRSDDYIKGLIAHELSEMSQAWKVTQQEIPKLRKMKPKAREIMINRILKQDTEIGSIEHKEHENAVNEEAIRLGFEKEIEELEKFS